MAKSGKHGILIRDISEDLRQRFKVLCVEERRTMQEVLICAIGMMVEKGRLPQIRE